MILAKGVLNTDYSCLLWQDNLSTGYHGSTTGAAPRSTSKPSFNEEASKFSSAQIHQMDSFHIFGDLLPELQDVIWDHAISEVPPRIIKLFGQVYDTIRTVDGDEIRVACDYVSNARIPEVLHVCARSRHLAKQRWSLTFDSSYRCTVQDRERWADLDIPQLDAFVPRTWFDFESDVLMFMGPVSTLLRGHTLEEFYRDIDFDIRRRIHNICISIDGNDPSPIVRVRPEEYFETVYEEFFETMLEEFPGLKILSISIRRAINDDGYIVSTRMLPNFNSRLHCETSNANRAQSPVHSGNGHTVSISRLQFPKAATCMRTT